MRSKLFFIFYLLFLFYFFLFFSLCFLNYWMKKFAIENIPCRLDIAFPVDRQDKQS